jgi:hypothetical protein
MYMRVTRGQIDPAKVDILDALSADVNAALKRLPGCLAVYQGGDRARGVTVAVTLFDTEAHARFSRELLGDLVGRLQQAGFRMETPEVFELFEAASAV